MYRDLFENEAEIRIDFTQYFSQLAQTGEATSTFDRIKYQINENMGNTLLNCWNQTFIVMEDCELQQNNKIFKIKYIRDYMI
jgi:hypothetical protein